MREAGAMIRQVLCLESTLYKTRTHVFETMQRTRYEIVSYIR
jgi:hypothetical protein